ncbi:perlucin-like [Sitophilus oryzae]|uniref:Perlucin-like n=1 Tax=Sitophilus oryzae TaxID=7048 RepID=A0A6J2XJ96_SITOR|nr:perlucin-like [Sitophilus oryzae]
MSYLFKAILILLYSYYVCACIMPVKEYVVFPESLGFFDAYINCKQNKLEPAEVHTEEEEIQLESALERAGAKAGWQNAYWIFGIKLKNKPFFYWMDSGVRVTYDKYWPGEPTNYNGTEDCLDIFKNDNGNFGWNDVPCNLHFKYICQKPMPPICQTCNYGSEVLPELYRK